MDFKTKTWSAVLHSLLNPICSLLSKSRASKKKEQSCIQDGVKQFTNYTSYSYPSIVTWDESATFLVYGFNEPHGPAVRVMF